MIIITSGSDWKKRLRNRQHSSFEADADDLTLQQRIERKLLDTQGRELYEKRCQTFVLVFVHAKNSRGCRHFMHEGLKSAPWKGIDLREGQFFEALALR
jgi:hypothetical protein